MKYKRVICRIFFGIFLFVGIIFFAKIRPLIKEYKEIAYDKLSNIDEDTFARLENTKVYDKNKRLIGEINSGSYQYSKIAEISKYVQEGYIAVEDHNFKSHNGIDYLSTFKAGIQYIFQRGQSSRGGSTITQQLIKNTFLTQKKTVSRKIAEFFLAPEIEKMYTKAQIMEYYCNSCYYANRCYGIGNASSYYFHKKPSQLSLAEAAMLVGISNNPSRYDPVVNYQESVKKKNRVLKQMLEEGVITETQYHQSKREKIKIIQYRKTTKAENYPTTFAVYQLTLELMEKNGFEFQYMFKDKQEETTYKKKYSAEYQKYYQEIRNGGYKIYTSFDKNCQAKLQKSIDRNLSGFQTKKQGKYELQGAGVSIDNESGQIVAAVGGRGTQDAYNRSYISVRQPGSSVKPLIDYTPAFESGVYYPSKIVSDVKTENGPSNADHSYAGSCTIREAVIRSKNTVAWNLLQNIGVFNGLSYLSKLQFANLSYLDNKNLSASLGGFTNGVRVVDMAKGFATLENGGVYRDNTCLTKVLYKDSIVWKRKNVKKTVYSSGAAYIMTDCMKDAVENGTGTAAQIAGQVVAGKTGTTNDNKDAWFCGYSRYYTTSVWVGCDQPKPMEELTGSSYPAKIFHDYMTAVHQGKAKKDFVQPKDVEKKNGEFFLLNQDETLHKSVLETIHEEQVEAAEAAVKKFESFEIVDVESADMVETKYNTVRNKVEQVDDADEKKDLRERMETHYKALLKEKEKWEQALAVYKKDLEQKRILKNEQKKVEAEKQRKRYEHQQRVSLAKTYIQRLNAMIAYDQSTETVIAEAETAVENCQEYGEYEDLKNQLDQASEKVRNLENQNGEEDVG